MLEFCSNWHKIVFRVHWRWDGGGGGGVDTYSNDNMRMCDLPSTGNFNDITSYFCYQPCCNFNDITLKKLFLLPNCSAKWVII